MSAIARARSHVVRTHHYVSQRAALRHFAAQGYPDPWSAVDSALASRSIEIGPPALSDPRAVECYPGNDGRYRVLYLEA